MRVTNPPTNPALLDALEANFKQSRFNLKGLVKTICQSTAYQLDSVPNEFNADDRQNFSRYYGRRLQAEVLLDAIDQVTKTQTKFNKLPEGTRAIQLPTIRSTRIFSPSSANRKRPVPASVNAPTMPTSPRLCTC